MIGLIGLVSAEDDAIVDWALRILRARGWFLLCFLFAAVADAVGPGSMGGCIALFLLMICSLDVAVVKGYRGRNKIETACDAQH